MYFTTMSSRRVLLVFSILLCSLTNLPAQNFGFDWALRWGAGWDNDVVSAMTISANKDVFIASRYPSPFNHNSFAITRADGIGNLWWTKSLSSANGIYANDLHAADSGCVVVVGAFEGSVDFTPLGDPVYYSTTNGRMNPFIMKVDAMGNLVWIKQLLGVGSAIPYKMDIDQNGDILIAGAFYSGTIDFDPGIGTSNMTNTTNNRDLFMARYDKNGNFIWAKKGDGFGTVYPTGLQISAKTGDIYLGASFGQNPDFDLSSGLNVLSANGNRDIAIVKYSMNGSLIWLKQIGGGDTEYLNEIALDTADNVIGVGNFAGTVNFGSGSSSTYTSQINNDLFIIKLNTAGAVQWTKVLASLNRKQASSVTTNSYSDIYIAGDYLSSLDFDPGPGLAIGSSPTRHSAYQLKLNSQGAFQWFKEINASGANVQNLIRLDSAGGIYTGGTYSNNYIDFDPTVDTFMFPPVGNNYDCFLQKLYETPYPTSTNQVAINERITTYPNPTTGIVSICNLHALQEIEQIELLDLNGKRLLSKKRNRQGGDCMQLNLKSYSSGTYYLHLHAEEQDIYKVVIKE